MGGWGCQDWLGRALPSAAVPVAGEVSFSRAGASGVRIQGGVSSHRKISGNKNSYSYIEVRVGAAVTSIRIVSSRTGRRSGSGQRRVAGSETSSPWGCVPRGSRSERVKNHYQGGPLTRSGAFRYRRAVGSGPFAPLRRVQPLASHTINRHTHSHSSNQCMGLILITLLPRRGAEARAVRAGLRDARRTCGPRHRVFKSLRQRGLAQCSMSTHRASLHETMPPPRAIRSPPPPATHSPKCGGAA